MINHHHHLLVSDSSNFKKEVVQAVTTITGKNRLGKFLEGPEIYPNYNEGMVFLTDNGATEC